MFVHVPPPPPSPQARALGAKIAEAVRILRREDPSITAADVRRGLRLADAELRRESGGWSGRPAVLAALLGAGLVVGIAVWLSTSGALPPAPLAGAVAGLLAILALVLAVGRGRSGS